MVCDLLRRVHDLVLELRGRAGGTRTADHCLIKRLAIAAGFRKKPRPSGACLPHRQVTGERLDEVFDRDDADRPALVAYDDRHRGVPILQRAKCGAQWS